jgi:predicted dehydrogenase
MSRSRKRATTDDRPVRIGVIGVGNMGSQHARSIQAGRAPGGVLAAVCDTRPERLNGYGEAATFTRAQDLLKSGAVDAVVIATPHPSHVELGRAAFRAGLHVLMEKPLGIHMAEAELLLTEPRRGLFAMMFNQRTDPCFQKVRELVRGGTLGELHRFSWTITDWFRTNAYYASSPWRATWTGEGGGVLLNQGVHNIDLLQWIFGRPLRVRAVAGFGRFHPIDVEDDVTALLAYADGLKGVFTTTSGEAPGLNRLEVAGDQGLLVLEGDTLTFRRNETPTRKFLKTCPGGYDRPGNWEVRIPLPGGHGPQHDGILCNFVSAIRTGEPLVAPGEQGIHSLELINAILLSAFEDRPVSLPLDAARYLRLLRQRQKTGRKPQS